MVPATVTGSTARVVIAGAGGGIGKAVAVAFAGTGAQLVLAGRTRGSLEATLEACSGASQVLVQACDVSRPDSVARLAACAEDALGGVDVLINAAGVHGAIGPAQECNPEEWLRALHVNLYGSFLLARAFVPDMLVRRTGRIILFSGGGATRPLPSFSAYAASKAGVVRFAETLAEELRPYIQVNAIAPGLVDTALLDEVIAAGHRAGDEYEQVHRVRSGKQTSVPSERAAELAVFLGLDASSSLTGRLISAPHDPWERWADGDLPASGLYTLRRVDSHTLQPLLESLS